MATKVDEEQKVLRPFILGLRVGLELVFKN